jgi:hypothetical protein
MSLTPLWHAQRCNWHRCDMHSWVIDTAVTCIAESLTPLWYVQWCHWHHYNMHIGVIDTTGYAKRCHWHCCATNFVKNFHEWSQTLPFFMREYDSTAHGTALLLPPLWHAQRCHWHHSDMYSRVIDTAVTCTVESLTPLWYAQGCLWHRCANMTHLWHWTSYSSGSGYL